MKKGVLCILFLIIAVCSLHGQTAYRFSYLFQRKTQASGKFISSDMTLDYDGKTAFFYNENRFLVDSLSVLAFDKTGNILDEESYGERVRIATPSSSLLSYHDFSKGEMTQHYVEVARFKGIMTAVIPEWELKSERDELYGYACRRAECSFLGRRWEVWYAEELPLPVGPWLFWGAPGVIVQATDEEGLFNFVLHYVEAVAESRLENWASFDLELSESQSKVVVSLPMKDMERLHSRYLRDSDFFDGIHGGGDKYRINQKTGERIDFPSVRPYIPLISDDYWK